MEKQTKIPLWSSNANQVTFEKKLSKILEAFWKIKNHIMQNVSGFILRV